ncbi:MAG: HD domain-containing protein [Saprospiraceae bacterium]|nr:HD domain-containing protein [Candidatus Defluviibacterium haderslevense]
MLLRRMEINRRKIREPYITHPPQVARICYEEIRHEYKSVIAALLHDVVEDTQLYTGTSRQTVWK